LPTKSELEHKVADLESRLASEIADRGIFTTELGKIALKHNFMPLIEFLNMSHEEMEDLRQLLAEEWEADQ